MKDLIESVALEGTRLTVTVRPPLPLDAAAFAVATAIHVFERYPIMDRVAVVSEAGEVSLSRDQVERLLHPDGLGALHSSGDRPSPGPCRFFSRRGPADAGAPALAVASLLSPCTSRKFISLVFSETTARPR